MADLKALFKAAQSQRGSAKPSKEQLRLIRAQKAAQKNSERAASQPREPLNVKQFDDDDEDLGEAVDDLTGAAANEAPATAGVQALPEGFFADKTADAKARGVKLPDAKDKEAEFQKFTKLIEEELKDAAQVEEEEAADAAADREEREAFEQSLLMRRVEELKQRKLKRDVADDDSPRIAPVLPVAVPPAKRMRVVDALALAAKDDDDSDDDSAEEEVLDWRAKKM